MIQSVPRTWRTWLEWILIVACGFATLFIWTSAVDSINLPKFVVLSLGASILAGLILPVLVRSLKRANRSTIPLLILILFLLALFISSVASGNRYVSFFGTYERNNGFLSSLALAILFTTGALIFRFDSAKKLLTGLSVVGGIEAVYGFAQHFGHDPIPWATPYNPVIGTFGNPDFMSALLGITSVALLWFVVDVEGRLWTRVSAAIILILALVTIFFSKALQGLLAFAIGAAFLLITWLYQRSRAAALGASAVAILGLLGGVLGMLQIGPLTRFLYKISISYRGDYWRAGFAMFKSHPILGVGPDRFGAYFRQYRDVKQIFHEGPAISSDAAHNMVIQIAATSGIFALLLYVALVGSIIWFGVRALRSVSGRRQLIVAAIFGAWLAYQAQSLISIDHLGIAVWGWSLGGVLVGLTQPEFVERVVIKSRKRAKAPEQNGQQRSQLVGISLATLFAIISLVLTGPMLGADVALLTAIKSRAATTSSADLNALKSVIMRAPNIRSGESSYQLNSAILLLKAGLTQDGRAVLQKVLRVDPRYTLAWEQLAVLDEKANNRARAVSARERMAQLDPYNAPNLLELGRDLKAAGDLAGARAIVARINSFAPNTPEAKSAQTELGG